MKKGSLDYLEKLEKREKQMAQYSRSNFKKTLEIIRNSTYENLRHEDFKYHNSTISKDIINSANLVHKNLGPDGLKCTPNLHLNISIYLDNFSKVLKELKRLKKIQV